MVVTMSTTKEEKELYKATIARKGIKSLADRGNFKIQEIVILSPEEHEEGERVRVAIKVDNSYYSGVGQDITATLISTCEYLSSLDRVDIEDFLSGMDYRIEKVSGGRYGRYFINPV